MSVCQNTLTQLKKMMRGKFPVLLDKYLLESAGMVEVLQSSSSSEERVRAAHGIKSTSASFGALNLSELAHRYEQCGADSTDQDLLLVRQIAAEFEGVKKELMSSCQRSSFSGGEISS